jgi:hypothetical protein
MRRVRMVVYGAGLVGSPLLLIAYWVLYPAYGDLSSADIVSDIGAAPGRTTVADVFAVTAVFLTVPASLAYLRALEATAPRLSRVGATLSVVGWMAILPLVVLDVVARELAAEPKVFGAIYTSGPVVALSAVATVHVLGGLLIGVALVRTRLVPRPLAVAATVAPVAHLTSNLAGVLWVDIASWLVAAATGVAVLPGLARLVAADESVTRREQRGRGTGADTDLGVHVLDVT